jgi:plastocyanin
MTRRFATLLIVVVGLLSVPLPAQAATATVTIGSSLSPKSLTVAPGTTVTWRNADSDRHRVRTTSAPVEIDSNDLDPGESYSVTLRTAGTYRYVDHREEDDANYWGTVTVSSSGGGSGGGTGGGGGGTTAPASGTVTMAGRAFSPSSISVRPGGTITFSNDDDRAHTVTASDRSFDSGVLNGGGRWTRTFRTAGTYRYFCAIHTEMTGTVTVPSASGAVPPPAPAAARPPAAPAAPAPPPAPPVRVAGRPAAVRVNVIDFGFSPSRATARVGDTVSWVNTGAAPHTVTAAGGPFGTSMLAAGATYRWAPAKTGTWSYVCAFHPQMTGTLVVLPKSAAAPRNAPAGGAAPAVRTSAAPSASSSQVVAGPASGTPAPAAERTRSLRPVSSASPLVAWTLWGGLGLVTFLALAWWRGREVAGDGAPRG